MDPASLVRPDNEASIQTALFAWASKRLRAYPELALMHHIPNGEQRSAVTGARLKAQGVKAGVPDICWPCARRGYHGFYLEIKALNGKVSEKQQSWLDILAAEGYCVGVAYSYDECVKAVAWYGSIEP